MRKWVPVTASERQWGGESARREEAHGVAVTQPGGSVGADNETRLGKWTSPEVAWPPEPDCQASERVRKFRKKEETPQTGCPLVPLALFKLTQVPYRFVSV